MIHLTRCSQRTNPKSPGVNTLLYVIPALRNHLDELVDFYLGATTGREVIIFLTDACCIFDIRYLNFKTFKTQIRSLAKHPRNRCIDSPAHEADLGKAKPQMWDCHGTGGNQV